MIEDDFKRLTMKAIDFFMIEIEREYSIGFKYNR